MSAHPDQPAEDTADAEKRAREKDPHGTAVAEQAAEQSPKGYPTDHRHESETAAER
jgi:hypothetical protein